MLYDDKYDNHFLNIECGRARFGDFGGYTLTTIQKPNTPPALAALAAPLEEVLTDFMADVVSRVAGEGTTQTNTANEDDQWDDIHDFITETDVKIVRPAYFNKSGITDIYPNKLSGLTQAPKPKRLARFEAYTIALETAKALLTDAPGKAARKLLEAYRKVAVAKDGGESGTASLIELLGPKAVAVCWVLWDIHCAGLAVYSRQPALAKALFNYGLLPRKKRPSKKKMA